MNVGVGWHITADREADVDYVYNNSDTDGGATTGEDSDGEGLTRNKRRHKRYMFADGCFAIAVYSLY